MAKKRKKKVYNTPKKNSHKHISLKLNILKVINNPKCTTCDNFLAVHLDRYTCTYCQKSIQIN